MEETKTVEELTRDEITAIMKEEIKSIVQIDDIWYDDHAPCVTLWVECETCEVTFSIWWLSLDGLKLLWQAEVGDDDHKALAVSFIRQHTELNVCEEWVTGSDTTCEQCGRCDRGQTE